MSADKSPFRRYFKSLLLVAAVIILSSHDLYLRMEAYFLQPNQEATLSLYNGTFEKSENVITRDRMQDASIVVHGQRTAIDSTEWADLDSTITQLSFKTGAPGTYVVGVATKARNIELSAADFNNYLEHDGVLDMLKQRIQNDQMDQDAVESYQKHVKAIFQVGDMKTNDWNTVLGYPIEFVPQANPYEKYTGEKLEVQLLMDGEPLPNQLVYANHISSVNGHSHNENAEHTHDDGTTHSHGDEGEAHTHEDGTTHSHGDEGEEHTHDDGTTHSHGDDGEEHTHEDGTTHSHGDEDEEHTHEDGTTHSHGDESEEHTHEDGTTHSHEDEGEEHTHIDGQQLRTNDQGIVTIDLPEDGIYYLRTIHMVNVTDNDELTHQSKWATLTFEVSHQHGSSTHTHDDHDHEDEFPLWAFVLGSLAIISLLFFLFRKKN